MDNSVLFAVNSTSTLRTIKANFSFKKPSVLLFDSSLGISRTPLLSFRKRNVDLSITKGSYPTLKFTR